MRLSDAIENFAADPNFRTACELRHVAIGYHCEDLISDQDLSELVGKTKAYLHDEFSVADMIQNYIHQVSV